MLRTVVSKQFAGSLRAQIDKFIDIFVSVGANPLLKAGEEAVLHRR